MYAHASKQRLSFATEAVAANWLDDQVKLGTEEQGPLFGGPSRLTLGCFLGECAARFSMAKKGCKSEIDRINHCVTAWELQQGAHSLEARVGGQATFNSAHPMLQAAPSGHGLASLPEEWTPPVDARAFQRFQIRDGRR